MKVVYFNALDEENRPCDIPVWASALFKIRLAENERMKNYITCRRIRDMRFFADLASFKEILEGNSGRKFTDEAAFSIRELMGVVKLLRPHIRESDCQESSEDPSLLLLCGVYLSLHRK